MKHALAAFTAVGVAIAVAVRERADQRLSNAIKGKGFVRDAEPQTADEQERGPEPERKTKKKTKKAAA